MNPLDFHKQPFGKLPESKGFRGIRRRRGILDSNHCLKDEKGGTRREPELPGTCWFCINLSGPKARNMYICFGGMILRMGSNIFPYAVCKETITYMLFYN